MRQLSVARLTFRGPFFRVRTRLEKQNIINRNVCYVTPSRFFLMWQAHGKYGKQIEGISERDRKVKG